MWRVSDRIAVHSHRGALHARSSPTAVSCSFVGKRPKILSWIKRCGFCDTRVQIRRQTVHRASRGHRSREKRRTIRPGNLRGQADSRASEVLPRWILQRHRDPRTNQNRSKITLRHSNLSAAAALSKGTIRRRQTHCSRMGYNLLRYTHTYISFLFQ